MHFFSSCILAFFATHPFVLSVFLCLLAIACVLVSASEERLFHSYHTGVAWHGMALGFGMPVYGLGPGMLIWVMRHDYDI